MTLQEGIDNEILSGSCYGATEDLISSLTGAFHDSSEIFISVGGSNTDLQTAIEGDGLCSSSSGSYSLDIIHGQKGEEIGLGVNGMGKTLQQAINDGDFCCEAQTPDFYYDCYCLSVDHSDKSSFYALEYNKESEGEQFLTEIVYEVWEVCDYVTCGGFICGTINLNPKAPLNEYYYKGINQTESWKSGETSNTRTWCNNYMNSYEDCRIRETIYEDDNCQ